MRALHSFIIETDKRYNNEVDVDGQALIVNTEITERDYHYVNRIGRIIATPPFETGLEVGDEVIVHHNVFRRWIDQHGIERNSGSFIEEGKYSVYPDQVFAKKTKDGWVGCFDNNFVAPITSEDEWSYESEVPLQGILFYGNEYNRALEGLKIGFTPDSEYEFNIDGIKLYRIKSKDLVWTTKKKENESLNPVT